jgi:hypothetical protein
MESTELIVILIHKTKGMECCARVSSCSWGRILDTKSSYKGDNAPQNILKIKCPRLAKNAFATQHLLHHSIIYAFIYYHTMNENGCISELIPTEQVINILSIGYEFFILFPPLHMGDPRACSRQPTASL